jgi:hypothetical protein
MHEHDDSPFFLVLTPSVPCVYLHPSLFLSTTASTLFPLLSFPLHLSSSPFPSNSLIHMPNRNPHRGPYTLHPKHLSIRHHLIQIRIIIVVTVIRIRSSEDVFFIRLIRVFPVAVFALPFGDFGGYEGGGLGEVSVLLHFVSSCWR